MNAQGFDQPIHREEDQFGRSFLADQIYQTLMSPGANWAVRVALNGDWGCGKTSIAGMIEARARAERHPVGWLHPWKMHASGEVAIALMTSVLTALENAGIELSARQTTQKAAGKLQAYLTKLTGLHAFADTGLSILNDSLAFDAAFAKPIAEKLAQRKARLLVIIDDLDRCDPAFLPPLLLFMRTAFDVPGVSFLAPFDSDVVAKAIRASNPAWTNADRFLEKVFDFRVPIPDLAIEQKKRFLISCLGKEQIFVADADVHAASRLLPPTPRAIKALARDIGRSRGEIERRQTSELNWSALLLATMLRATSLEFYRAYLRDVLDRSNAEDFGRNSARNHDRQVKELWDLVGHIDEATRRRVDALVNALEETARAGSFEQVRRALHFMDEHEPMTWKEFEEIVARWQESGLDVAIGLGMRLTRLPEAALAAAVATHAMTRFQRSLEHVLSESTPTSKRSGEAAVGLESLALATGLVSRIDDNGRFDLFSRELVHDREADADDDYLLCISRRRLLESLANAAQSDWLRYDDCITRIVPLRVDQKHSPRGVGVSEALRVPLKAFARIEVVRRLEQEAGLDGVFEERSGTAQFGLMARLFLDPSDEMWAAHDSGARAILGKASDQTVIRENARAALLRIIQTVAPASNQVSDWQLMAIHMERQPPYSALWCVTQFVRSGIPLSALWKGYTAIEPAGDVRNEARITRQKLILLGAPEEALPLRLDDE